MSDETVTYVEAIEPLPYTTDAELSTFEALKQTVARACIVCQSYLASRGPATMYTLGFHTAAEQIAALRPIIRALNKAERPDVSALPLLPLPLTLKQFLSLRARMGNPNDNVPSMEDAQRLAGTGLGLRIITLFLAAPQDTPEDATCYMHAVVSASDAAIDQAITACIPPPLRRDHTEFLRLCALKMCAACGVKAALRCKACGVVYYCTDECQRADWQAQHRHLCGLMRLIKWRAVFAGHGH
jgi:hypothetical protein